VFKAELDRATGVETVQMSRVAKDMTDFREQYMPGHPAADARGYVKMPNVNSLVEMMDMREAQRTYEANLSVIDNTRAMLARTVDLLKR
jgi:flagellar basal-body rod protein FlgC